MREKGEPRKKPLEELESRFIFWKEQAWLKPSGAPVKECPYFSFCVVLLASTTPSAVVEGRGGSVRVGGGARAVVGMTGTEEEWDMAMLGAMLGGTGGGWEGWEGRGGQVRGGTGVAGKDGRVGRGRSERWVGGGGGWVVGDNAGSLVLELTKEVCFGLCARV